jgi:hypothetical protein
MIIVTNWLVPITRNNHRKNKEATISGPQFTSQPKDQAERHLYRRSSSFFNFQNLDSQRPHPNATDEQTIDHIKVFHLQSVTFAMAALMVNLKAPLPSRIEILLDQQGHDFRYIAQVEI